MMPDSGESSKRRNEYGKKMPQNIREAFDEYVDYISRIEGVLNIYLFGSYAYGEPTAESDIDLLIIVRDDISPQSVTYQADLGLKDRKVPLDLLASTASSFQERTSSGRVTLQNEIKKRGVLVCGR